MFATFIPRASFPVSRQPSPTLQIFSIKRYVGPYDHRSPPPFPSTRDKSCPLNLRPQLLENDHVYVDGGRASYRQRKPAREVFLALLLKRDSFCGRFSGGLPLAHASTKPWRPLSVCSREGFFCFCTFLHSEAQKEAGSNQGKPQC